MNTMRLTRRAIVTAALLCCTALVLGGAAEKGPEAGSAYKGQEPAAVVEATETDRLTELAMDKDKSKIYAVRGKVTAATTSASGKVFRIRFEGADGPHAFIAVYFPKLFDAMQERFGGAAGSGLNGKRIEVVGVLEWYEPREGQGQPEIVIKDVDQVRVVEE